MRTAHIEPCQFPGVDNDDQGTPGDIVDGDWRIHVLQLPWRDDKPEVSREPSGVKLILKWGNSPKHGPCYICAKASDGRTMIEVHSANVAGDASNGFASQLEGCFAPGLSFVLFPVGTKLNDKLTLGKAQWGVSGSKEAVEEFVKHFQDSDGNHEDIELTT